MSASFLPSMFMSTSFLSSILVPSIGYLVPAVTIAFIFLYIERDDIA